MNQNAALAELAGGARDAGSAEEGPLASTTGTPEKRLGVAGR